MVRILNSPPRIKASRFPVTQLDGHVVQATDPDDDLLTFKVEEAPPGLSVHPTSGRVSWNPKSASTKVRRPKGLRGASRARHGKELGL